MVQKVTCVSTTLNSHSHNLPTDSLMSYHLAQRTQIRTLIRYLGHHSELQYPVRLRTSCTRAARYFSFPSYLPLPLVDRTLLERDDEGLEPATYATVNQATGRVGAHNLTMGIKHSRDI